ncbi:MAG: Omp28-related outer membrane protein [Bacteroides sp.]|nr:Omp28-related outer membrane protein [Bacteroides sp.]
MRKIFSLAALAMLCSSAMNVQAADTAEGDSSTFDYTLAYDYAGAFQSQAFKLGGTVYQAFIIDAYNADLYADTEITSINITAGNYKGEKVNKVKNVTVFLAEDLDSEPFYTQSGKLGDEGEVMYKVALDKPYKIEKGKPVVVGYSFRLSSSDINYITVDNTYHENMAGGWIGYKYGDAAIQWENISHTYGNLCIGCTLKGESFPQNGVAVLSLDGAEFAEPGKNFEYTVYFQNTAANTVNSMEVSYTIGDGTKKTGQVNLRNPLKYNERSGLKFSDLSYGKEGIDVPVTFEITKVNGEANISDENKRTGYLNCFNAANGFKRVHLMEEGTGTWCQWCPAGIVMMDNLAKNYPEDYALVGVHYNDAMQVASTAPVIAMFGGSYPNSYIDRSVNIMPTMASVNQTLKAFTEYYREIPALVGFPSIKGVKTEDGKLKVNTDVQFALDLRGASRYRLSYYIVEDGVGPYEQQNGFAGGESGPMGGWESKGLYVSTLFNDVARYLEGGMEGVQGSIPGSVKQGESYSYEVELPLTNVTKDKVRVVAFVVDTTTGTVVNAAQKEVDLTESGIEEIADAASSEILSKTYYTLNGVEVKDPSNGIYILRTVYADGTVKAEKVVVK